MIPMAISLGFGMLFATVILLILVPCLYLGMENVRERLSAPRQPALANNKQGDNQPSQEEGGH